MSTADSDAIDQFIRRHGQEPLTAPMPPLPAGLSDQDAAHVRREIQRLRAANAAEQG